MKKNEKEVRTYEQTKDEFLNTIYIKEIIEEYFENPDDEHSFMIFGHLMLRLNEEAKAPMPMMNVVHLAWELDPDIEPEEVFADIKEPEDIFVTIPGENGHMWIPLFTGRKEMGILNETNTVKEIPIIDIIKKAYETPGLNGVLVNPYTDGFILSRENLGFILDHVEERKREIAEIG